MSRIADTARLETATETLAELIGFFNAEMMAELGQTGPSHDRVRALRQYIELLVDERKAITPDTKTIINRALYVYAPLLKAMRPT
jgi:hypothetical protein